MVPRNSVVISISLRELPFALIGIGGGALATWAAAPPWAAIPIALLVTFRVSVQLWRGRSIRR